MVLKERQELEELERLNRETHEEAQKDAEEGEKVDKTALNVAKRVGSMIEKLDQQLEEFDKSVGARMNIVNVDEHGKISTTELTKALSLIAHA